MSAATIPLLDAIRANPGAAAMLHDIMHIADGNPRVLEVWPDRVVVESSAGCRYTVSIADGAVNMETPSQRAVGVQLGLEI